MRIVLVAMKAGGRMEEHHADSDISVHCLDGAFRVEVAGTAHELVSMEVARPRRGPAQRASWVARVDEAHPG